MKKLVGILAIALIFLMTFEVSAAVNYKKINLRGKSVNVVTVDLNKDVKLRVAKPNNKRSGTLPFNSFINCYGAKAAINGNYFEAYKGGKYPFGTQMKNREMINMNAQSTNLMIFDDYKAKVVFGDFEYILTAKTPAGRESAASIKLVNEETNLHGNQIYNSFRNRPTKLNGGTVVEVVNNVIAKIYNPTGQNCKVPENGYFIYFDEFVPETFVLGASVSKELYFIDGNNWSESNTFNYNGEQVSLNRVTDIVSCSPALLLNGENVTEEQTSYMEPKIKSMTAQRSALGLTADGKLILVTTVSKMSDLALIMKDLGSTDAFNLDGGASSALYVNGKYVKQAGRQLNTVLLVQ